MENSDSSRSDCPYELWDEETVYSGPWITAKQVQFRLNGTNSQGVWQSAHRASKPFTKNADGVDIVAVLKKGGKKYFVLVKQYRIPSRTWMIEFPAGLVDTSDADVEACGLRELKEETGYSATKVLGLSSGKQILDVGMGDDSVRFLTVEIDGDAEENKSPKQELTDDEHIQVLTVECDKLLEFLDQVNKSDDTEVEAILYTFALGYSFKTRFGL
ncbi:NUDIX domain-containing protein [Ditylenchus destructor]|uniref:NUDIX domain-containing protein n=1 Tax=Ditylenchus destructor TaxID=166010 RepID=A0AAD4R0Z2_9BILA|nr:NUDIX domain-containing protein [Ditylenchus destructor]